MTDNNIKTLALQETRMKQNTKEARSKFTWFLSGEIQHTVTDTNYTAGVGIVVSNDFVKYIDDIIPHSERILQITLKGSIPINILSIYIAQAGRPEDEKEKIYKKLDEITNKIKGKGPTYLMGDWNARMQTHQNKIERTVFWKMDIRTTESEST